MQYPLSHEATGSNPLPTKCMFYVPVTVHREQSMKKEYQQDATT